MGSYFERTMFDDNPRKKRFVAPMDSAPESPPQEKKNPFMSARQKLV